jgi:hypothetical protein
MRTDWVDVAEKVYQMPVFLIWFKTMRGTWSVLVIHRITKSFKKT